MEVIQHHQPNNRKEAAIIMLSGNSIVLILQQPKDTTLTLRIQTQVGSEEQAYSSVSALHRRIDFEIHFDPDRSRVDLKSTNHATALVGALLHD